MSSILGYFRGKPVFFSTFCKKYKIFWENRKRGRRASDTRPYDVIPSVAEESVVILSDRRESKNLRIEYLLRKNDNAKILRRGFALLRMTGEGRACDRKCKGLTGRGMYANI